MNDQLCGTKLWGAILELCCCNPDEALVQYYQSMMKQQINAFNCQCNNWIKEIEIVKTILQDLNSPFTDQEFS